jgi:HEAT repeat protein
MISLRVAFAVAVLLLPPLVRSAHAQAQREEWYRGLALEHPIANANLIVAATITAVEEVTLTRGGKGENTMYQYTFQPVRIIKGVFARPDLGGSRFGHEMQRLRPGEMLLLFLGRSAVGYENINRATKFHHALVPIRGAQDPLLQTVETLVKTFNQRDRSTKADLLLQALSNTEGPATIPLLKAIEQRALIVAQKSDVPAIITKHLGSSSAAVREACANAIQTVLDADYLQSAPLRAASITALANAVKPEHRNVAARAAALNAFGASGPATPEAKHVISECLNQPMLTIEESAGIFRAIGGMEMKDIDTAMLSLSNVPLDEPLELARARMYALVRVAPEPAAKEILARIVAKIEAGIAFDAEIEASADFPLKEALHVLGEVSKLNLLRAEKRAFADASDRLASEHPKLLFVEPLANMLDPNEPEVRWSAVNALLKIGTSAAAKALQPHLAEEENLSRKLQIAELLGRHGMRDGYAYAIEHMSEPWLMEDAVKALASLRSADVIQKLQEILRTSNDLPANRAALRALGATEDRSIASKCLEILQDPNNELAPDALIALGDLREPQGVNHVRKGFSSRSDAIVTASARAAGKLLAELPQAETNDIRDALKQLIADPRANIDARNAALESLVTLNDQGLNQALVSAVKDGGLENTDLLRRVEELLRKRKVKL